MNVQTDSVTGPATLQLTDSQKGLLVVDGRAPARSIYNQVVRMEIDPAISAEAVADALVGLATIQPALRQVFAMVPQMHARLAPPPSRGELAFTSADVTPGEFRDAAAQWAVRVGQPSFDLASGPPWRAAHVRAADGSQAALLLVLHHIIGDGVSVGPLVRDLESVLARTRGADAIQALATAREAALIRELREQNKTAAAPGTAARARAWADRLRDLPAQVLNPAPGRPVETEFSGARLEWLLTGAESQELAATAKRLDVTPFVLFIGIYSAVIARHAAASTVLIGSPFTARRTVDSFDLCGFFVNTMPVMVGVDWERPFDQHAREVVQEAVTYCWANVSVAFNQLVAQVRPDRSTNRNPLFSHMLVMQDTFDGKSAGIIRGVSEPGIGTAKFDLWTGVTPVNGRWLLELEYDTQIIEPAVADGLLRSLRTAMLRMLADSGRPLADLFTDASSAASLRSDGYPALAAPPTIAGWLTSAASQRSDAAAIEDPTGTLSYGELAAAAGQAARGLVTLGVRPGDVVGICLDTLSATSTAILAIGECGAAYLPLDPSLPAERLRYMVGKAECKIAIGAGIDAEGLRVIGLAEVREAGAGGDGDHALPAPTPDTPGYVMFTSGSSGQPKSVLMGQEPLLNLTAWQLSALEMDEETRFLQYAPLGFDVSFQEIVPTLVAGGVIVSREPADRRDFPALLRRLADTQITHVYLPVAALRPFVQSARAQHLRLPKLRYLCVSGEQLTVDDQVRDFFAGHPHCTLVNLYGPTETHAVTTYRLSAADPAWPAHVPIGLPLAGVHGYVVDATGHLAPAGVPGELFLGGRCPARGYLNDEPATTAAFLPDRFAGSGIMYRTGDRVLRDSRGQLIFLGREDTQVKVRGYRIELGELESAANSVSGVRRAVAAARGTGSSRELVLFLLAEDGVTVEHDLLRRRMAQSLPAYMLPAHIFDIDSVPTTGAGKTDRAALVALAERRLAEAAAAGDDRIEFADELERELAGLWAEALGVPGVRPDTAVMEYGAHSLSIFTVLARVEQKYGVAPPIAAFFRSPTVAVLAEMVRAGQGTSA